MLQLNPFSQNKFFARADNGAVLDIAAIHVFTRLIRLNDQDIPYSPDFKFYMTTKVPAWRFTSFTCASQLRNPHYLPEIAVKVTIINFTVTPVEL